MTTPTAPEAVAELLPVTQEDREAAADYLEYVELLPDAIIRMVRIGKPVDHALSLHMARHRLAAEARAVAPGRETFCIVLPNGMGTAEVRSQDDGLFAVHVIDGQADNGWYRSAWNLPTFEEAVRNILEVIWPGCLPFEPASLHRRSRQGGAGGGETIEPSKVEQVAHDLTVAAEGFRENYGWHYPSDVMEVAAGMLRALSPAGIDAAGEGGA